MGWFQTVDFFCLCGVLDLRVHGCSRCLACFSLGVSHFSISRLLHLQYCTTAVFLFSRYPDGIAGITRKFKRRVSPVARLIGGFGTCTPASIFRLIRLRNCPLIRKCSHPASVSASLIDYSSCNMVSPLFLFSGYLDEMAGIPRELKQAVCESGYLVDRWLCYSCSC